MLNRIVLKIHFDSHDTHYVPVENFPFTLGRSIKNSFIFDRSGISASHFLLEKTEEGVRLVSLGKTNGVYFKGEKIESLIIDRNLSVFLGPYKMEIFCQDFEESLDKTQELVIPDYILRDRSHLNSKVILKILGSFLFILVPSVIKIFFTDPLTKENYQSFLMEIALMGVGATFLAGLVSLFSKIHCKKYQFPAFIFISNFWMGLLSLYSFLPQYLFFYLGFHQSKVYWSAFLVTFLTGLLIYRYSLYLFARDTRKKTLITLLSVVFFGVMIKAVINSYDDRWGNYDFTGSLASPLGSLSEKDYPFQALLVLVDEKLEEVEINRKKIKMKKVLEEGESL